MVVLDQSLTIFESSTNKVLIPTSECHQCNHDVYRDLIYQFLENLAQCVFLLLWPIIC